MMATRRYEIILCRNERQQLPLDVLASRTGLHPELIERFVEFGLLEPIEWEGSRLLFDASCILRLHVIARLRETFGINLAGIAVIFDLLEKLHVAERENEILRSRL